eukprot:164749_1
MSTEEFDNVEDMSQEEYGDEEQEEQEQGALFWSMKLEPNKSQQFDAPAIEGYIIHITNACFGPTVAKNSRTVVMVNPSEDEEDTSLAAPICVLRSQHHENHPLDLLFNESASITLKGNKPSTVYLTGYIQPPVETMDDSMMMDPGMEDMTEEEIETALKVQRLQQMALDEDEEEEEAPELEDEEEEEEPQEEEESEEEEEVVEPPTKKQKTQKGAKATKKGKKGEESKKRKSPQQKAQKAVKSPPQKAQKAQEEEKGEKSKKNKKSKKMGSLKGGIKFRDMKVGNGKQLATGDKVSVFYVGQTDDKKVFDKAISGNGFEFNFGKGDVIKGWDLGLKGMKVGGKRKLIIPSKLAYGSNGSPPSIPPNATLTFTIEVRSAK